MDTHVTPSGGTGDEFRYPPTYSAEEYIPLLVSKLDLRRFATMPSRKAFVVHAGFE